MPNNLSSEVKWHSLTANETILKLNSSEKGLTNEESKKRLTDYGFNELIEAKKSTPLSIFINQFKNVMVLMLLGASIISFIINEFTDAMVILVILIVNAVLGFFQEYKAEKAMEALKSLAAPKAVVIRDGEERLIWSRELVPGDIVVLNVGDIVPANLRLISSVNLKVDQSHLTGESVPATKDATKTAESTPLADRHSMIFMGSIVSFGKAIGIVTQTGMNTEIGVIAKRVTSEKDEKTPLDKEINVLAKWLAIVTVISVTFVFFFGLLYKYDFIEMLLTSVSVAVSAVPEGLPAVITITLAIGMQRMAAKNAVIRRLNAVQTLGSVTTICSDKTGTITKNEMTVKKIFDCFNDYEVTGSGYEPTGDFLLNKKKINPLDNKQLKLLLTTGLLCNNAHYGKTDGSYKVLGDPTEGCLLALGAKAGLFVDGLKKDLTEVSEISFTSERKRMSVVYESKEGIFAYVKGAPDVMLNHCTKVMNGNKIIKLTDKIKKSILDKNKSLASEALRVLAIAYKPFKGAINEKNIESNLILLGLVGMIDPARPEVIDAIKTANEAGIRVMIVTGDHKLTATAIAREIGLYKNNSIAFSGEEIDLMSPSDFTKAVMTATIFARVSPEHKLKIVNELKKQGEIIAVTGDGVNDAPALKSAHIGIAMGIKGTDVSKQASDMVLTDDNFSTIIKAVEEGRGIFNNIKKFIRFLLSSNVDTIFVVIASIVMGLPLPYVPLHILWMNLITDGFPALALSVDTNSKSIMKYPPRSPKKSLIKEISLFTIVGGLVAAIASIILFLIALQYEGYFTTLSENALLKARTMGISSAIIFELFFVFNCRSDTKSIWERSFKKNFLSNKKLLLAVIASFILQLMFIYSPLFQSLFNTVPLNPTEMGMVLLFASFGLLIFPKWFNKEIKIPPKTVKQLKTSD